MEAAIPHPPEPARRSGSRLLAAFARSGCRLRGVVWSVGNRILRWRGADAAARVLFDCHPTRRPTLLRALGAHIGEGVSIHTPFVVQNPGSDFSSLSIGSGAYLGPGVLVDLRAPVSIGPRAAVSARVSLITHLDVGPSRLSVPYPPRHGAVSVAADAYLGAGATILHGVRIGEMSVIGAGAVVRGSVPSHRLAAGVPARLIGPIREAGPAA